jgi:hypothetical protein
MFAGPSIFPTRFVLVSREVDVYVQSYDNQYIGSVRPRIPALAARTLLLCKHTAPLSFNVVRINHI